MDKAKELKTRDLDIKEKGMANKVPELGNGEGGPITNNFILATRDQIFASMFGSPEDKQKDPLEKKNVVKEPAYAEKLSGMRVRMLAELSSSEKPVMKGVK